MKRIRPISHDDRLSVVDHLDELRSRIVVSLLAVGVAFGLTAWQNHLVEARSRRPPPDRIRPRAANASRREGHRAKRGHRQGTGPPFWLGNGFGIRT